MAENNTKPELRFKGFTGEWKKWKIGEILTEKKCPIELKDKSEYRLVTVKRRNEGVVPRGILKGKDILVKNYFVVEEGDYIISKRQIIHGANGIVPKSLHKAIVSNEYLAASGNDNITTEFWALLSKLPDMYKKFFVSSYGVDIEKMVFDVEDWKKRTVRIPAISEQKRIICFFNHLDKLLALHRQQYEKLTSLKKAMLVKMFPQEGADVPEIRFKGFTGAWVKRKLCEVAEIVGGGTPSTINEEYWDGDIDWYSPTEIGKRVYANGSMRKITTAGLESCSAKILPANKTVLFTSRAGIGDMAILKREGTTNQGFQSLVLKDNIDTYFIYSSGHLIKKFALKHASGSTFLEISGKTLGKMEMLIPVSSEQEKIGEYFKLIDNLISKYHTQLTKLKNIKKACFEKMFV